MKTNYEKLMKINYEKLLIFYLPFTRPSRLTHGLGFMMGKNTAPAAVSTAILKLQRT